MCVQALKRKKRALSALQVLAIYDSVSPHICNITPAKQHYLFVGKMCSLMVCEALVEIRLIKPHVVALFCGEQNYHRRASYRVPLEITWKLCQNRRSSVQFERFVPDNPSSDHMRVQIFIACRTDDFFLFH